MQKALAAHSLRALAWRSAGCIAMVLYVCTSLHVVIIGRVQGEDILDHEPHSDTIQAKHKNSSNGIYVSGS